MQQWWSKPASPQQAQWKAAINAAADAKLDFDEPTTPQQSATLSTTAQSLALRWAMTRKPEDLGGAVKALKLAAGHNVSEISRPEVTINFLIAYDLIHEAEISAEDRQAIERRLVSLLDAVGSLRMHQQVNNILAKRAATRAFGGLVLRNQALLDSGLTDLSNSWVANTLEDGWYTDSPVHYFNYILPHVAPFAVAYKNASGVDLAPRLTRFFDMMLALRMPDGRGPNIGDGLNSPPALHYFSRLMDPIRRGVAIWHLNSLGNFDWAGSNLANNDRSGVDNFLLTDFNAVPASPATSPTFIGAAPGGSCVTVFRNNWTPSADYFLLNAGVDGQRVSGSIVHPGHGHNDTGEIVLYAQGQLLLTAPGYARSELSNWPAKTFNPVSAANHNVLLVDGDGGNGASMRPEQFVHTDRIDAVERGNFKGACDFAALEYSANNAHIRRAVAYPNEDYFVVVDWATSGGVRTYTQNLIGRGGLTRLSNEVGLVLGARWEVGKAQAIATVVSGSYMSPNYDTTWTHDALNRFEPTQRMKASMRSSQGGLLTFLEASPAGTPPKLKITNLSQQEFCAATVAEVSGKWTDAYLSQPKQTIPDTPTPTIAAGELATNGLFAYVRVVSAGVASGMVAQAQQLEYRKTPMIVANAPVTLSFVIDGAKVMATVSPDGIAENARINFPGRGKLLSVTYAGVPIPLDKTGEGIPLAPGGGPLIAEYSGPPASQPAAATQPSPPPGK